jgi:dTDP-4-amino-4,6-dideoxygalactose transaminase
MCRKFGISLVEDGAQAFGVELVGSSGGFESVFHGAEIATLSFYPAKVLGGCMDGGAVLTSSAELAKTVRSLLNHGRKGHYSYEHVGWNSRMASVQGLYLRQALHHAPQWLEQRREILRVYHDTLTAKGVMVRVPPATIRGNGYLAVAQLPTGLPFVVQKKLEERGIGTGRVYPETIHQQLPARHASRGSELSVSSDFVTQVINLPLFPGLSPSAQNEVIVNFLEAL